MGDYLLVAAGGAAGSVLRYWLGGLVAAALGARFPYGTLVVNLTGSFLIGYVLTAGAERLVLHPSWRLLLGVGLLGGYTTFSAFEYETLRLIQTGGLGRALGNVLLSVVLGLAACWGGMALAREAPLPWGSAWVHAAAAAGAPRERPEPTTARSEP